MYLRIAEYPLLDCGAFMVAVGMVTLLYIVHSRLSGQAGHARLRTVCLSLRLTLWKRCDRLLSMRCISEFTDPGSLLPRSLHHRWCGHCKKLDPIYKKLAKRFKTVDSVVIAKMDGTENEHPDIEVKGFPTIIFYPAGKDSVQGAFEQVKSVCCMVLIWAWQHAMLPQLQLSCADGCLPPSHRPGTCR